MVAHHLFSCFFLSSRFSSIHSLLSFIGSSVSESCATRRLQTVCASVSRAPARIIGSALRRQEYLAHTHVRPAFFTAHLLTEQARERTRSYVFNCLHHRILFLFLLFQYFMSVMFKEMALSARFIIKVTVSPDIGFYITACGTKSVPRYFPRITSSLTILFLSSLWYFKN